MSASGSSKFGVLDYCLFFGVLIISGIIGLYTSYKGNKSPEEFLMGNRSFKILPVTISLLMTLVSAVSLLGYSGEAYANGMQFSLFVFGVALAILFSSYFIVPIVYPLKLTSITEYIELRFKSECLRMVVSILILIKLLFHTGVLLYAPTIVLSHVTKLSVLSNIFLLGIICTLYSAFGGIRAVIWTDVFQFAVMLIGLIIIVTIGCIQNGGFFQTFYISSEGGRLDVLNLNPSPFIRHTVFNVVAFGFFHYLQVCGASQLIVQRVCAVTSIKNSKRVLTYNIFGMFVIYFLIFTGGLVAYASYAGCDPMELGIIKRKEQIITYFISDKLSFIPGLSGIFVATLMGGTLSSLSSMINAGVALVWKDVCLRFTFFKSASSSFATLVNKIISFIVGALLISLAVLASYAGSILEYSISIFGTFSGPILGVYLIGYFLPKCNIKGVWTGFIVSIIISVWIALGGLLYKKPTSMLPFSVDECGPLNFTLLNNSTVLPSSTSYETEETISNSILQPLYEISYTLYGVISPLVCILLAVIVSCLTGCQSTNETSPKYISPSFRKFYWKKEELQIIEESETNLKLSVILLEGKMLDEIELKD